MRRVGFFWALLVFLATLLASCGADPALPEAPGATVEVRGPQRAIPPGVMGRALDDLLRADLATRLRIPVSEVGVRASCALTWPDGSLGVAQPGAVSAQVLSPGFLALLSARGREYRYHGTASSFIATDFVAGAQVDTSAACP